MQIAGESRPPCAVEGDYCPALSLPGPFVVRRFVSYIRWSASRSTSAGSALCTRQLPTAAERAISGAVDDERLRGGGTEPLRDRDGVVRLEVLAQHRELVAAEPGGGVAGPQQGGEPMCELDQHGVTRSMAELVVHRLEAVEVEIEQMARSGVAAAMGQEVADPLREQRPVRQPGQRIVQGLVAEFGLALLAFADVLDVNDLVLGTACGGRCPGDAYRHPDLAPIHAAESAFVAHDPQFVREHHRAVLSGIVHVIGVDHVVQGGTEQRSRIGTDQLAHRRIARDDRTVHLRHDDAHRRVVERAVHGRVHGARCEGRHLRSYPRVTCGRLCRIRRTARLSPRSRTRKCRCTCIGVSTGRSLPRRRRCRRPTLPHAPERSGNRSAAQACGGHAQ